MSLTSKIYAVFVFNLDNFTPDRIFLHGHRPCMVPVTIMRYVTHICQFQCLILQRRLIARIPRVGSDGRTGVINLNADDKIILDSQIIDVQSKVSTKIFSENTVHVIGKSLLNIYGGLADFADGATKHRRSKLSADDSVVSQNEVENAK